MTRVLIVALAASVLLLADEPPAVQWNKDTVTPTCPSCTAELPLSCARCPGCGEALTWKDLEFDPTPAGAFIKLKYALKYNRPDLLKTCVTADVYTAAEAEQFKVEGGPLQMFLLARIKKVEKDGDLARLQFEAGEGKDKKLYTFEARKEADGWRLGPPGRRSGGDVGANEALALRDLLEIVEAERRWRENDPDGNHKPDLWTRDIAGLCAHLGPSGKRAGLLREDLARADPLGVGHYPDLGKPAATHGYWYQMLRVGPDGERLQRDVDLDGSPFENGSDFAVCAWPDRYGETGKRTFIVSARGRIFAKDLGGAPIDQRKELTEEERAAADRLLEGLLARDLSERAKAAERILALGSAAHGWLGATMGREEYRAVQGTLKLILEAIEPLPYALDSFPSEPKAAGWTFLPMGESPR